MRALELHDGAAPTGAEGRRDLRHRGRDVVGEDSGLQASKLLKHAKKTYENHVGNVIFCMETAIFGCKRLVKAGKDASSSFGTEV